MSIWALRARRVMREEESAQDTRCCKREARRGDHGAAMRDTASWREYICARRYARERGECAIRGARAIAYSMKRWQWAEDHRCWSKSALWWQEIDWGYMPDVVVARHGGDTRRYARGAFVEARGARAARVTLRRLRVRSSARAQQRERALPRRDGMLRRYMKWQRAKRSSDARYWVRRVRYVIVYTYDDGARRDAPASCYSAMARTAQSARCSICRAQRRARLLLPRQERHIICLTRRRQLPAFDGGDTEKARRWLCRSALLRGVMTRERPRCWSRDAALAIYVTICYDTPACIVLNIIHIDTTLFHIIVLLTVIISHSLIGHIYYYSHYFINMHQPQ